MIPDQLPDRPRVRRRPSSVMTSWCTSLLPAYCPELRRVMVQAATEAGATVHDGGTMVVMEGAPVLHARRINFYRQIGGDLIGMTALPRPNSLARQRCTTAPSLW